MTKTLSALLLSLLATSAAHADLYTERQEANYARARASRQAEEASAAAADFAQQARLVQNFVARLGGASEGSCSASEFACNNGSCGEGRQVRVPIHSLGAGGYFFAGCSVTLNDGQACVINRNLSTVTWNYEGFVAYCYDANAERHVYYSARGNGFGKKVLRKKR